MKKRAAKYLLDEPPARGRVHLLCGRVELAQDLGNGKARSTETITRAFSYPDDPFYGELKIDRTMMERMVRNFADDVYGQRIAINLAHRDGDGAAGFIDRLFLAGNRLRAEIDWTEMGLDAVRNRGFRYFSAEFDDDWKDPETEKRHGATLLGAALTIRPRVKRLDPIDPAGLMLAETPNEPGAVHYVPTPGAVKHLSEDVGMTMDKYLKQLREAFEAKKLSAALTKQLTDAFAAAAKNLGDDEKALKALTESFITSGAQLAEELAKGGNKEVKLSIDLPQMGAKALSAEEMDQRIAAAVAKTLAEKAEGEKKLAETVEGLRVKFREAIDGAEGLKALSEEARKGLLSAEDLITADMTTDQVAKLAEHQISMGNQLVVQAKLAGMGYGAGRQGNVHIAMDEGNAVKELQETVDRRLGILDAPDSRRYSRTGGQLTPENKALADRVLAQFDRDRGAQLHAEHKAMKQLAAGDGVVSDVNVPVVWERSVIREALYNLVGTQFVDSGVLEFANSYSIPYSYRDTTAAGRDSTRKYEGQSIARAGVIQTAESAYNIPQKLAFEVSDELRFLTQASALNWEAISENQRNASRIINEDLEQLIFNEMLRASDEYAATAVSNENLELQADDAKQIFILANFPVVRPRAVYDLQGNQVGSTTNPITVTYNSVALAEYDGTGAQAAGNYYVMDYNLGEIYLVNQAGVVQTPANATAYTISYSYASNAYAFDTDLGALTTGARWDQFLYRWGLRKAIIEDDRYHMANFGAMSGTLANSIEQADKFKSNFRVPATELATNGNIGRIKDVPVFRTTAPGLHQGDVRAVMGERGITRLRMTKPWMMEDLENQKDANGRFTGKKEAYGSQFLVLHTPTQLKRALTSIVTYSATARVARAA